jgi:hypothetical protein
MNIGDRQLFRAIDLRSVGLVRLLLAFTANPNAVPPTRSRWYNPPLIEVARRSSHLGAFFRRWWDESGQSGFETCQKMAKILLRAGANVNGRNGSGETALHEAIPYQREPSLVPMLIFAGADVNARNNKGETPLHIAAGQGNIEVAQALLAAGADVNAKDERAYTPILHAGEGVHYFEMSEFLERAGATDREGARLLYWKNHPEPSYKPSYRRGHTWSEGAPGDCRELADS